MYPNKPVITTIIPTFQRPRLLRRAIESVLSQTVDGFVLHIHDNASQDETPDVVAEYQKMDPRIKYFRRETNVGLVQNFALALDSVTTPYFSFLSDDDYLLPCFYDTTLSGFAQHPEAGFSAGCTLTSDSKGRLFPQQFLHPFLEGFFSAGTGIAAIIDAHNFPQWTSILFNSKQRQRFGGLDVNAGNAFDREFILRYAASSSITIQAKPCAILMSWKYSASYLPENPEALQLNRLAETIMEHFEGPNTIKELTFQKLHANSISCYRHIWIRSLISDVPENARQARKQFLDLNGSIHPWKLKILTCAETSFFMRKTYQLYFHLGSILRFIFAYCRTRKETATIIQAIEYDT